MEEVEEEVVAKESYYSAKEEVVVEEFQVSLLNVCLMH
jgi:hypothetical protein